METERQAVVGRSKEPRELLPKNELNNIRRAMEHNCAMTFNVM